MADYSKKPSNPREPLLFRLSASAWGPDPASPAGGGGFGQFTCRLPTGSSALVNAYDRKPGALSSKEQGGFDGWWDDWWGEVEKTWDKTRADVAEWSERVEQVKLAFDLAFNRKRVMQALEKETGMLVKGLPDALYAGLKEMAGVLVKSTLAGAVVGGVLTIEAGGVGAIPVGILGFKLGVLYLTVTGLAEVANHIADNIDEVMTRMRLGVERAWNAGRYGRPKSEDITAAADIMAGSVGVLFRLTLEAIAAVILIKGIGKTVASLAEGRFGKEFAHWVEQNQKQLATNPKLKPKPRNKGGAAEEAGPGKSTGGGKGKADEVKSKASETSVPRGFKSKQQYEQCMGELDDALKKSGVSDAKIGVRGSAVTGVSSKGGPFRDVAQGGKPPSDVDVFIESRQLTKGMSESKSIPGFVHPNKVMQKYPKLEKWSEKWSAELGREITPGAFKANTVPAGPKIISGGK